MKKVWLNSYKKEPVLITSSDSNFESSDDDNVLPVITGPKKRRSCLSLRKEKVIKLEEPDESNIHIGTDVVTENSGHTGIAKKKEKVIKLEEPDESNIHIGTDVVTENSGHTGIAEKGQPEAETAPIIISDTDISSNDDAETSDYYKDVLSLPVFARQRKGTGSLKATQDVMENKNNDSVISKRVPSDISDNVSFLVSTKAVGNWKNMYSDGMGAWEQSCVKTRYISLRDDTYHISNANEYGFPGTFMARRYNFVNKSEPDLKRVIVRVFDSQRNPEDIVYIEYYFVKEERQVTVRPHANSKYGSKPYVRTQQSTKDEIKSLTSTTKPKDIFHSVLEAKGGIGGLTMPGQIARDRQQIYNLKRQKASESDELKVLMDFIGTKTFSTDNDFYMDLATDPELILFIANETQLAEIERFCTYNSNFCILGVDPTFNIGNYYVTITSYRHLKLHTKQGIHPVMMGPVLIHQRKLKESYFELPCKMIKYNNNLENILAFGTDGEHNLQRAMSHFYPNALHLLCDVHMKDNIYSKLSKLLIPKGVANEYMTNIFGKDLGQERQPGLVDSLSENDFDLKLKQLRQIWYDRHLNGEEFYLYFSEEKAHLIKAHMSAEVRMMAGLGYPPISYTNNPNESLNSAFKGGLNKKLTLQECVDRVIKYINHQQEDVKLSLLQQGVYSLCDEYSHLKIDPEKFYRLGERSKKAHFKTFIEAPLKPKRNVVQQINTEQDQSNNVQDMDISQDQSVNNTQDINTTQNQNNYAEQIDKGKLLSVTMDQAGISNVPADILKKIFDSGETLLQETTNIVKAPGKGSDDFFVASLNTSQMPHFVRVVNRMNGHITCDDKCIRWKSFKICSHIIALSEKQGILPVFLERFKKINKQPRLMALATHNLPKKRGQKAIKSTSVRKGPPYQQKAHPVCYSAGASGLPKPKSPSPTPGSYVIAILDFCNSNVSKCFGCQRMLKENNVIPLPPRNLVIVSNMKRTYVRNGVVQEGDFSNVYFHFNEACVKAKDAYFVPALLFCPDDIKPHLSDRHAKVLSAWNVNFH